METFAEVVRSRAGDPSIGLRFEDRSWTWGEVVQEAADRAAALAARVPRPDDRQVHVGVLLENVPDFVFWVGAGSLAGAVVVGINASRSGPEIAQDVQHADVDVIVTESRLRHLVTDTGHGVPEELVLDVDTAEYAALLAPHRGAALPAQLPAPDQLAMLLFSSGSTGAPKAVVVGQGRLGRLTQAIVGRVRMRPSSITYLCMPLFHGNAVMMNLAPAMAVGAQVCMTRKFSASAFGDDLHRFGATYVNYVGRALSYALSKPVDPRDADSALELAFGTEASEADVANFSARFGCEVMEGYGLSEGVFRINRTPDTPTGALGLPANDAAVRVLDESTGVECPRARFDAQGRLVDPAAVGQLVAVGLAHTFEGYYKNPGAYADRVKGDDFWSGDLGYRDEDGFFYFAGRSSDWLRVDSENFSAAPVERLLQRMDGVASAPVFAVPDPRTGDQVMTALELEPGVDLDPVAFGAHLEQAPDMGAKWWPRFVRIVAEMPLTGSGKVDKAPLRREGWLTRDPVLVRVGRTSAYVPLDDAGRRTIEAEFAEHGRSALLPAAPVSG
ncbi:Long-chain-fatty-acid--CoA ligase FadD17 [Nocardioides dokdonensis FR1436]|uniref:Long-chain-fatty-acid--CoA ligase FadD17 n=1 Tax=Nocardioides dokdonensis FR1436 TaxID=1300347 RepID=A0A1A9GFC9_9ACTN|nr:AMP-binding protein [Nocardioides dokdonensis]ANH37039.1 Long-chain-fatty-acid--CoA ligase FadD17 [Nocardioides dokdonensis FR1436]